MQVLKDVWDGLAIIGLMTVVYGCHFVWRQAQRASESAKYSQRVQREITEVAAVEDRDDIGI